MEGNPRHLAYLQIWSSHFIPAGSVVVTATDTSEDSQSARDDHVAIVEPMTKEYSAATQNPIGVSDRDIPAKTRGTIVLSGIVNVRRARPSIASERRTGQYFFLSDLLEGEDLRILQPIGTLVDTNLEGEMVGSNYCPTVSIFLCPWLCAQHLPVASQPPPLVAEVYVDFEAILSEPGWAKYKENIGALLPDGSDDEATERAIKQIGHALYEAISINESGIKFMLPH